LHPELAADTLAARTLPSSASVPPARPRRCAGTWPTTS